MPSIRRREFITIIGGGVAWPMAARGQQPAMPMIGFLSPASMGTSASLQPFRQGLGEAGFVEGNNVEIEYRWANGQYDRLPALAAGLVRRQVAVIATPGSAPATLAAKAATTTIPIVFGIADDPVRLGLVTGLARPGGNVTGINFFSVELVAKRLGLLHELVPKAVRIAVLVNPANVANTESMVGEISEAARAIGLQIQVFKAGTADEIDIAFTSLVRERADALFVAPDSFFASRRFQFATLAARYAIPTSHFNREAVEAGGLMSYSADRLNSIRLVGVYAGRILKGAKPADLPVMQSTKFEFVINMHTAKLLGIDVPPSLFATADEIIQ